MKFSLSHSLNLSLSLTHSFTHSLSLFFSLSLTLSLSLSLSLSRSLTHSLTLCLSLSLSHSLTLSLFLLHTHHACMYRYPHTSAHTHMIFTCVHTHNYASMHTQLSMIQSWPMAGYILDLSHIIERRVEYNLIYCTQHLIQSSRWLHPSCWQHTQAVSPYVRDL